MPARHAVFTISRGVPFLPTLAEALLSGRLVGPVADDPLALAAVTIYLPTRRAARALGAILAERLGRDAPGRATLLPRMIPLGEADEAELDLAAEPLLEANADPLSAPMPPLERRLILARLVQAWAKTVDRTLLPLDAEVPFLVPSSPADAVGLAGDLERLMDALTVEGLPWSEIGAAVEAEYSRYFGLTLDFVKIADRARPADGSKPTAEQVTEYRRAVTDFEVAFDLAEREARRTRDSGLTDAERKRLATASRMLAVATDDAATPAERHLAYQRVREEIDGLIALSDEAVEVLEKKVAQPITERPNDNGDPAEAGSP